MFIDGIPGMDRVLSTDVNPPYLTLVTGPPGSMKSTFCLSLVSNHLRQSGGFGLYCTVEETTGSLLRSSHSLGRSLPQNLQITDFTELRNENEAMDYLKFTQKMIEHFKRERGDAFTVFVLDSLGAIYSLTNVDEEMRKRMFKFFEFCRSQNLHTFVITELQNAEHAAHDRFLADSIINLGLDRRNGQIVRTLQIEKMRHIRHSMEKQAMEVTPSGLSLLGPLFD